MCAGAAAVQDANIKPEQVQEVYLGNVLSAGVGQAPARQAALVCASTTLALLDIYCFHLQFACMPRLMLIDIDQNNLVMES